jgi:hypothetical protein
VRDGAHTIISEYLTPAGKALWADMIKIVKTLGDVNPADTTALLNAPTRDPQCLPGSRLPSYALRPTTRGRVPRPR